MLEFKADEIDWAVEKLSAFDGMPGYPGTIRSLEAHAAALLRIAHPNLVDYRFGGIKEGDELPTGFEVKSLSEVRIGHPKLGSVNPVDWLIAECLDKQVFFPQPVTMRQIFCEYFPPADGKEPWSGFVPLERKSDDHA